MFVYIIMRGAPKNRELAMTFSAPTGRGCLPLAPPLVAALAKACDSLLRGVGGTQHSVHRNKGTTP